ncbi:unnamed protein product [Discosporangium mesarthrocarpum]
MVTRAGSPTTGWRVPWTALLLLLFLSCKLDLSLSFTFPTRHHAPLCRASCTVPKSSKVDFGAKRWRVPGIAYGFGSILSRDREPAGGNAASTRDIDEAKKPLDWAKRLSSKVHRCWTMLARKSRVLRISRLEEPQGFTGQQPPVPCMQGVAMVTAWAGVEQNWLTGFFDWVVYKAQLFLISPFLPTKAASMLAFSCLLVALGGLAYKSVTGSRLESSAFKAFALLNNTPGSSAIDEDTPQAMFVTNVLYMTGLLTFSVFLGVIASEISTRVDEIHKGNFHVVDSGHTLMLNWNEATVPILRQLSLAEREGRRVRDKPVVILADRDKQEMDKEVRTGLKYPGMPPSPLTVVTRRGRPSRIEDLDLVSAGKAKRSIILRPASTPFQSTEEIRSKLRVQSVALQSVQERALRSGKPPLTVVHLPCDPSDRKVASAPSDLGGGVKEEVTQRGRRKRVSTKGVESVEDDSLINVWQDVNKMQVSDPTVGSPSLKKD